MPYVGNRNTVFTTFTTSDANVTDDLTVTDDATIGGVLSAKGGAVFNEDSADVDFRVESNGSANAFIVDGGHSTVGINTAAVSNRTLKIEGEGNVGAGLSLSEETRGVYIEFTSGSSSECYIGTQLAIKGSGNDDTLIIHVGTEAVHIDRTGAVTMPVQPAFLAQPSSQQSDVAADTTIAFGTEIFDQNADFASNTFTAPVTGKYQLSVALRMDDIDAASDFIRIGIHTSNRQYYYLFEPDIGTSSGQDITRFPAVLSILADMDANDTATVVLNFTGGSAQTNIITDSYFSGFLAC